MKHKLLLSNLTADQKQGVRDGSIAMAALLSGAGIFTLFGMAEEPIIDKTVPEDGEQTSGEIADCLVVETDAEFAEGNFDGMEFSGTDGAFATARELVGPGGFFQWRGQTYNTYTKEEWDAMDEDQLADFASNLEENSNYDSYEFVEESQLASQSYDLNNDGVIDVVMADVDGDGIQEVSQVDLNSDGEVDVIHDPTLDTINEAVPVATEAIQEAEPVYGVSDSNQDGIIDAVVLDNNNDGFVDTIIVDQNHDGIMDSAAVNVGDDEDLDILIVDENDNLQIEADEIDLIEEELRMDEFIIVDEEELEDLVDHPVQQDNNLYISDTDIDQDELDLLEL
jgi:hypothetical protein